MKKENDTLIISAILAIIILIALASCGSRKVESNKIDKQITTETKETKKDSSSTTTKNNIFKTDDEETIIYEPINNDKPIVINGISYINTRLINQKRKSIVVDTTVKKEVKTGMFSLVKKEQSKEIIKDKNSDRKDASTWLLIGIILTIVSFGLLNHYFGDKW
jgi:uncharacterized protein with gpF-like domain